MPIDDLPARLRRLRADLDRFMSVEQGIAIATAADELERLRAVANPSYQSGGDWPTVAATGVTRVTMDLASEAGACSHPAGSIVAGPRVPHRHGSGPTEICTDCGMYRSTLHAPGAWWPGRGGRGRRMRKMMRNDHAT